MRALTRSAVVVLGLLLVGGSSAASPLAFTAVLTIELRVPGVGGSSDPLAAGPIELTGAGIADASGGGFTLPAGAITGSFATDPVLGPGYPIVSQQGALTSVLGSFGPSGGDVVGSMGFTGSWQWGLFGPPPAFFVDLPIGPLGVGGSETRSTVLPSGTITYRMDGATWTTGSASVSTPGVTDPLVAVGFDGRDASGVGEIRLVSPLLVDPVSLGVTAAEPAGFATLVLHFVPEPATLLLLSSGIAGLVMLGRTKRD